MAPSLSTLTAPGLLAGLMVAGMLHAIPASAAATGDATIPPMGVITEDETPAPVDFGLGPGVKRTRLALLLNELSHPAGWMAGAASSGPRFGALSIPVGAVGADIAGFYGPPLPWPLVAVHNILLPGGRVMSYGSDSRGHQGASLIYDVWNPELGTGLDSHFVLPNTTTTNIFCSAQAINAATGNVLITGGSHDFPGYPGGGFSINNTTVFTPGSNSIKSNNPMNVPRWYATLTGLPDGTAIVLGGRRNDSIVTGTNPTIPAMTPERFVDGNWVELTGATSAAASVGDNWYYPRVAVAPGGKLFIMAQDGTMYTLDPAGTGAITEYVERAPNSSARLPAIPFAPGKMLYLAYGQTPRAVVVDFHAGTPAVTMTSNLDQFRYDSDGTILPDGEVLLTGGSSTNNTLAGADYAAAIWNPATGAWTLGAHAAIARLYHSTALLLPDGSVLSTGGGDPGPVTNLNAQIYYPPYLYAKEGNGSSPATRPTLTVSTLSAYPGGHVAASVGPRTNIGRLTMVRTGSSTHSTNFEQRFIELGFTQTGQALAATLPTDPGVLVPGYYMVFAIDLAGTPSVATIMHILPQ